MGEIIDFIKVRQENCDEHDFIFVEKDEYWVVEGPIGGFADAFPYDDDKGSYNKLIYKCSKCGKSKVRKEYY